MKRDSTWLNKEEEKQEIRRTKGGSLWITDVSPSCAGADSDGPGRREVQGWILRRYFQLQIQQGERGRATQDMILADDLCLPEL